MSANPFIEILEEHGVVVFLLHQGLSEQFCIAGIRVLQAVVSLTRPSQTVNFVWHRRISPLSTLICIHVWSTIVFQSRHIRQGKNLIMEEGVSTGIIESHQAIVRVLIDRKRFLAKSSWRQ